MIFLIALILNIIVATIQILLFYFFICFVIVYELIFSNVLSGVSTNYQVIFFFPSIERNCVCVCCVCVYMYILRKNILFNKNMPKQRLIFHGTNAIFPILADQRVNLYKSADQRVPSLFSGPNIFSKLEICTC